MNEFIAQMTEKAKRDPKRVAFPESDNVNVLKTAEQVAAQKIGYPMLIGSRPQIEALAAENGISCEGFSWFDNTDEQALQGLAEKVEAVQKAEEEKAAAEGRLEEYSATHVPFSAKAVVRKSKDAIRCAMFLLKAHETDCVAAGKDHSTGDVVHEAGSIVGMQEGVESPSSIGIADVPGFAYGEKGMFGIADCAITAQPDAKDLAGIAIASADTVTRLLGWTPRVAMLAFSTDGSAEHESIDVIREGIRLVHERRPDILCDGEFQLDAALLPEVAAHKVHRDSPVAGKANILIFPNLHAGNIGVKLIQIFGHANAYGPVLQGFAQPVCDFSRSAPVDEMLGNVAMLIIRAGDAE
ncbi:MAG: phosphate acetyltransferase [Lachnospiraceae bacterium]|nr:phosphate acetyltransferase [Lachnospiraceae bacterium]